MFVFFIIKYFIRMFKFCIKTGNHVFYCSGTVRLIHKRREKLVIVVDLAEMVMFSMYPERVLVDGDIARNKYWVDIFITIKL